MQTVRETGSGSQSQNVVGSAGPDRGQGAQGGAVVVERTGDDVAATLQQWSARVFLRGEGAGASEIECIHAEAVGIQLIRALVDQRKALGVAHGGESVDVAGGIRESQQTPAEGVVGRRREVAVHLSVAVEKRAVEVEVAILQVVFPQQHVTAVGVAEKLRSSHVVSGGDAHHALRNAQSGGIGIKELEPHFATGKRARVAPDQRITRAARVPEQAGFANLGSLFDNRHRLATLQIGGAVHLSQLQAVVARMCHAANGEAATVPGQRPMRPAAVMKQETDRSDIDRRAGVGVEALEEVAVAAGRRKDAGQTFTDHDQVGRHRIVGTGVRRESDHPGRTKSGERAQRAVVARQANLAVAMPVQQVGALAEGDDLRRGVLADVVLQMHRQAVDRRQLAAEAQRDDVLLGGGKRRGKPDAKQTISVAGNRRRRAESR